MNLDDDWALPGSWGFVSIREAPHPLTHDTHVMGLQSRVSLPHSHRPEGSRQHPMVLPPCGLHGSLSPRMTDRAPGWESAGVGSSSATNLLHDLVQTNFPILKTKRLDFAILSSLRV